MEDITDLTGATDIKDIRVFDPRAIRLELKAHAKALGIPSGAAEAFATYVVDELEEDFYDFDLITVDDVKRAICKTLKKYDPNFAYVYKNRDKII